MKTTKLLLFPLLIAAMATMPKSAMSQVTIGKDKPPETFSVLELISSGDNNNMGLRLPQLTEVERDNNLALAGNSLANGLTIYNLTKNCVQYWNDSGWIDMGICGAVTPAIEFPVPEGCGDFKPKPVVWMAYNLGAATSATINISGTDVHYDLTTPKGQMKWLRDKEIDGGGIPNQ